MRLAIAALSIPFLHAATEIPPGTHALLRMVNSVSTRTAREGDYVYMRTATPIVVDGEIVVPVESYVQGVVLSAKRSGRASGRAVLAIRIESLTLSSTARRSRSRLHPGFRGFRRQRPEGGGQRERDQAGQLARSGCRADCHHGGRRRGPRRSCGPQLERRRHRRGRRQRRGSGNCPSDPRARSRAAAGRPPVDVVFDRAVPMD